VILLDRVHRLLKLGRPLILGILAKRAETASREYFTIVEVLVCGGVVTAYFVVVGGAVVVLRSLMGGTGDRLIIEKIHNC
jgi:hypothetical protein